MSDLPSLPVREVGQGRPILCLHGWTCHGGFFAPQFEELSDRFHLLAPDLPGHGEAPGTHLTIEAAADAVHALIAERGLDRPLVVGWSMGAAVAWSLIARHGSGHLGGLVVIDMSPKVLNDETWTLGQKNGLDAERNTRILAAMETNWPAYAPAVARNIYANGGDLEAWTRDEIARNDAHAMTEMWRSLTAQDFRSLMPVIDIPVVIARGGLSRIYAAATSEWIADRIPDAEVVAFAASGHAPHLEEPEAFNTTLARVAA